jgi:hypothetical protein
MCHKSRRIISLVQIRALIIEKGDITRWDSGLAFGIAWVIKETGGYHSLNCCIGLDKKI